MPIKINEIFYSIQGESLYSGMPCIFIRLTGCNLRCFYCDTAYAYEEGQDFTIPEIEERIKSYSCDLVLITGGEPLMQEETPLLINRLIGRGYRVLLETNGTYSIENLNDSCISIMDVKCPSSNEAKRVGIENIKRLRPMDQLKFVVGDRRDYDYAVKIINQYCMDISGDRILLSPVSGELDPAEMASWMLEDNLNVRLQVQLHKILWPGDPRGR